MLIIGEKINATRKAVKPIILERRTDELIDLARRQAGAGATHIDINVGTGTGSRNDEIDAIRWAVMQLKSEVDQPICIDSADPAVIAAGLEACDGHSAMINSVKAEEAYLNDVLPLAARFEAPVVSLAMDHAGIPKTTEGRLAACRLIAEHAGRHGVPVDQLYFDPLVLPVAADAQQGLITLQTLTAIKAQIPEAKTVMGLSNVSYGLPGRTGLNAAFLHMALYAGLDAVIMDPLSTIMVRAVLEGEALTGRDRHFRKYTRMLRKQS